MSWTQPSYEALARLVGARTGLSLAGRTDSAELGMSRAMARAKMADPALYLDLNAREQRALDDLIDELTVGETYFFREPGHFNLIRRVVLPDLRQRQRMRFHELPFRELFEKSILRRPAVSAFSGRLLLGQ